MEFQRGNPLIIMVAGRARSGKGVVSDFFRDWYLKNGKKVVVSPYTKYLKRYIYEITGNTCEGEDKPRDMLQQLSSGLIKNLLGDSDFFVRRQLEDLAVYSYFMDVVIIPDVRFPREIAEVKKRYANVVAIGVERLNYVSTLTREQQEDETETSLDGYREYDFYIENSSLEQLEREVFQIIKKLEERILDE